MFWSLVLGVITGIVIWQNRTQNRDILPTVITTLMGVQIFFLMLMVLEANPFESFRLSVPPSNGNGLEPLFQNPAMTFHPPSILSGYVWFTVPFAFAVAPHSSSSRRLMDSEYEALRCCFVGLSSIGNLFSGMGLSRTWVGRLLGLGSCGECITYALVHRNRLPSFGDDTRAPRYVESLEHCPGYVDLLLNGIWHLLNTVWSDRFRPIPSRRATSGITSSYF